MANPANSPDDRADAGNVDAHANGPEANGPAEDVSGVVWFLSGDLVFASRVRAAAENAGLLFRLAGSLPHETPGPRENPDRDANPDRDERPGADADGGAVRFVVVDLATRASLVSDAVAWAAKRSPRPQTLAYGPHVQAQRLRDASEAGIDRVMTRGQFDSRLASLFLNRG